MGFAENLKHLPKVSHLLAIELIDAEGNVVATIENKPGQAGSLSVYNHLGQIYGAITAEAAKKGLELYAEHTADAQALLRRLGGDGAVDLAKVVVDGQ